MKIRLVPINKSNWRSYCELSVHDDQKQWISSNTNALALAYLYDEMNPMGIEVNEKPVGFLMYAIDPEDSRPYVNRLMIDKKFQKKGYGKEALRLLIKDLESKGFTHLDILHKPDNEDAILLYRALGFVETKEQLNDDVIDTLELKPANKIKIEKQDLQRHLNISTKEDPHLYKYLKEKLKVFNNERSPHHQASRKEGAIKPYILTVNIDEMHVGSLYAYLYWDWMEIEYVIIEKAYQRQSVGKFLMQKAEEYARTQGCNHIHLSTFSFQAPEFYKKLGYEVFGEQKDFPPGESHYWLRKDL